MSFRTYRPLATILLSGLASVVISSPALAEIDRLQLINGAGNPSVNPGTDLSKGVLFENQLIFAGTNLTTGDPAELHGANNDIGAFTIGALNGTTESPIVGVTAIDEFAGALMISSTRGVSILDPGAIAGNDRASGPINGQDSLIHAGNYYLRGNFVGGSGNTDLVVLDDLNSSFQLIAEGTNTCFRSLAATGNSTVIFIDQNAETLNKVIAPSTTPSPVFDGGLIQPFNFPCTLVSFNNRVFFHAFEAGTDSDQIFSTDGTASGTQRLRGFNIEGNGTGLPGFREFNGQLLFAATDSPAESYGLWSTDGTEAGTVLINDMGSNIGGIDLLQGIEYEGVLFFPVDQTLWRTDGTTEGTVQVMIEGSAIDLPAEVSFSEFDEELYFVAATEGSQGIFRIAQPSDTPERVSGIMQTPVAVNGELGQQLLVAANNDLFVMPREPVLTVTANTVITENEPTGIVSFIMQLSEAVPYEVSFSIETMDEPLGDGNAVAGNDYLSVTRRTQVFPAGVSQVTREITLQNDSTQEPDETFIVRVSDLDGARFSDRTATFNDGTITITDSDLPVQAGSLQVQSATVGEGGTNATITVITGSNSEVDIAFDFVVAGDTATAGVDFTAASGSGTIAAGSSSTTITIPVLEDTVDEPNETFTVTVTPTAGLSAGLNMALAPALVTIIDNDDAAVVTPTDPPAAGGGGGGCSIATSSGGDPLFPGLVALAMGLIFLRGRKSIV